MTERSAVSKHAALESVVMFVTVLGCTMVTGSATLAALIQIDGRGPDRILLSSIAAGCLAGTAALGRRMTRVSGLRWAGWVAGLLGVFAGVASNFFLLGAVLAGGGWGRPLRIRGRVLYPSLREGSQWTRGETPNIEELDAETRRALEALWLHDAQKEHTSIPAFSRISWQLAAVGAPAELLEATHRAAIEEIDHARRCFALAEGYGGRSHSIDAMPDLLIGGLDTKGNPLEQMALGSLSDGCLLEDFNADVAAACVPRCQDPAVRRVLAQIAREERGHAELSWRLLEWLVERGGTRVARAVERRSVELETIARPTATSRDTHALVSKADPAKLLAHGPLPDAEWAKLWIQRVRLTRELVAMFLDAKYEARALNE